jgi:hypothetical protein
MKFVYIPAGNYKIGQILQVRGKPVLVESYSHTGHNLIVTTIENAPRFERMLCICTDDQPIEEQS